MMANATTLIFKKASSVPAATDTAFQISGV